MFRLLSVLSAGRQRDDFTCDFGDFRLRLPMQSDCENWIALRAASRAFLQPWEPIWPADDLTVKAFRRRIARYRQEMRADSVYPFFLERRTSGQLLGGLTLANIRRRAAMSATLGYWMGAEHAGKGIMSAAVPALCDFGFAHLALERIEAACLPENIASIRVLEKAGFHREGFARGYLSISGARRDHMLFARLRTDRPPD
jgi:[ribosomal protein S5]-alanine N-acetyltransferase